MIVLPITLKAFETLDSKPRVKKARLESVFHSRLSSDFFFHKGEGLKLGEVVPSPLWIPHPYNAFKVCALRKLFDSIRKKGVPFCWNSQSKCRIPVDSQRRA